MKIIKQIGNENVAVVYIGETESGKRLEFVESLHPPLPRDKKWVLVVSSLEGCPVECEVCDAGGSFKSKLTADEILSQIDYMVERRFPDRNIPSDKFKIQFSRIGEPSFNKDVLKVLRLLPERYNAPGLMPTISTVAPAGTDSFFNELLAIKKELYSESFQLQFSIHSTSTAERNTIIPIDKWPLAKIAEYGERFFGGRGRQITLNFIITDKYTIDPEVLLKYFSTEIFFIKMTPLNPTFKASKNGVGSGLLDEHISGIKEPKIVADLKSAGFNVLLSIGDLEENQIGSNCGQYIKTSEKYKRDGIKLFGGYEEAIR